MGKLALIALLLLVGCAEPRIITKTEFVKLQITDPGLPTKPEVCDRPNYVLLEYKGVTMVAEPVDAKLKRLECDADKLRYTKELLNTITYYREVTK